ncbi:MAG: threonyl-tRNA synthetase editing domain-containing protein [Bacteroidales bacterium]|nr:threonyl-tRNA synthetase editing domain-containing protein [Bacteroidales bacterium]
MKILFIYCKEFGYTPTVKTVENAPDNSASEQYRNVQVAFIHVEQEDIERYKEVEKKLVKNLKWICGKNQAKEIVLHSFAHLSESKADPEFTEPFFNNVEERMKNAGYDVYQTPFGYFLDLQIDAPGFSLARVFKKI